MKTPMFAFLLREHLKISIDRANKLASVLTEETLRCMQYELEEQRNVYLQREKDLQARYDALKNESLNDMIKRIAAEVVEKEVKQNLSIEPNPDPYSHSTTPVLEWKGEEIA
jgi:ferric iron reductase protein FhuF